MGRVQGKVSIITGGASGVGREDAKLLVAEGGKVVIADLNVEAGEALAAELGEAALFVRHDISCEDSWQRLIEQTLKAFGKLDVLVNNAGILVAANIEQTSLEVWRKVNAINSDGYFLGCKYAILAMKETGGGAIINMSSLAAIHGMSQFCAYSASKGAVAALTRNVAVHCKERGYNIRCNSIHPDGIDTPMTQALRAKVPKPRSEAEAAAMIKAGKRADARMCDPKEIANFVLYLASDESRFINGAELKIDNAHTVGDF
ncbi:SDR family oxidoreductase [Ferrimonas pelagia]|uniref:SDR family oxidoreductase n=1 Tax=Ferrimonas pelagia TaxID=1177826 RepID=A0ABP9EP26_9GAMM